MKRWGLLIGLVLACALSSHAQTVLPKAWLWCEQGGHRAKTNGVDSSNRVQESYPSCVVDVYLHGTLTHATLFSDSAGATPLANPFTATAAAFIGFYAAPNRYDVRMSSGGIVTPFSISDITLGSSSGGGGGGTGTVRSVGLAAPTGIIITNSPVTNVGTLTWSMPTGWTTGDVLVGNGTNSVTRLAVGASGTVLSSNGTSPVWSSQGFLPLCNPLATAQDQILKYTSSPPGCTGSSGFDDGTNPTSWPNGVTIVSNAVYKNYTNANPGTVLSQLVQLDSAGAATNAVVSSARVIGVAGFGAGNSGQVEIAFGGKHQCTFDNQTVANDYVTPSATSAGQCHDAGSTRPVGVQIVGIATAVNAGAATPAVVDWFTGDSVAAGSAASGIISPCGSSPGPNTYYTASATVGCDTSNTDDGSGNTTLVSSTYAGTGAGYAYWTQGSQPSFPVANTVYLFAPTSVTAYQLKLPAVLGSAADCLTLSGVSGAVGTLAFAGCGGGGGGTVTSFSAGTLSPLFTTSVATATTTPALSFTLSNAAGGTLYGNATGASTTPAFTPTPVLGIPGTTLGTLSFSGNTSGTVLVRPQAAAGSPTLTFPNASGTFAVSATSPLVLSATTGALTCPTCNTSSASVTSVAESFTGGLISVAGSPITSSGTLALTVAGTSGGIPYFSSASTWASSAALTANLPVIGGGAGVTPSVGSVTGNTTQFATWTGATTASRCVQTDASGNLVITASSCGTASSVKWNGITDPDGALTLTMATNKSTWNYSGITGQTTYWAGNGQIGTSSLGLTAATDDFTTIAPHGDIEIRNHSSSNSILTVSNGGSGNCILSLETPTNTGKYPRVTGCTNATPASADLDLEYSNGTTSFTKGFRLQNSDGKILVGPGPTGTPRGRIEIQPGASDISALSLNPLPDSVVGIEIHKTNAPTTFVAADSYIKLGQQESGANDYWTLCFGFTSARTNCPAVFGYQEASDTASTKGDLVFGTRNVTSDTAPTLNFKVLANGDVGFFGGKGQHLVTQAANSDTAGTVTVSASTTGVVTFTTAYTAAPACVLTPTADPTTTGVWWVTTSTTALTAHVASSGTISFFYHCTGNPN